MKHSLWVTFCSGVKAVLLLGLLAAYSCNQPEENSREGPSPVPDASPLGDSCFEQPSCIERLEALKDYSSNQQNVINSIAGREQFENPKTVLNAFLVFADIE